jgi:hypothetical protein
MLYLLFIGAIILCTYLVLAIFVNSMHTLSPAKLIEEFGEYILYGVIGEFVLITLFSYIGGLIGLAIYSIILFILVLHATYANWSN